MKTLLTMAVIALAATWAIGEGLLVRNNRLQDKKPGVSIDDLKISFTGGYKSMFEARVKTDMRQYLANGDEVSVLASWAQGGGDRAEFSRGVSTLVNDRCTSCHAPGGKASFQPLTSYEEISALVKTPAAPSASQQLLVTKVHLAGIGLMLALLGLLFTKTAWAREYKGLVILFAYLGLFADFGAWWLMRVDLRFAWGRVFGNSIMSLMFVAMCGAVLLELWKKDREVRA
jgi:hypothetical protein